jgi:hypothetical protein
MNASGDASTGQPRRRVLKRVCARVSRQLDETALSIFFFRSSEKF